MSGLLSELNNELDNKPPPSPGLFDQLGEYLRRSGRNLATGAGEAADWLAQGAKAGAEPTLALMRGDDLDQPLLPTVESGGRSRLGAVAGGLNPHLIPGATPAGALGIFGGIKSKTANLQLLQQAKNLIAGGADPEAVRQSTGWMKGFDGEWKYEISDHLLDVKVDPRTSKVRVHHPDLRRAYPDLMGKLKVEWFDAPLDKRGRYDPENHVMHLNSRLEPSEWNEVVAHELQHPIQDIEGFSGGASPTHPGVLAVSRAERDQLRKQHLATLDEYRAAFDAWKAAKIQENPKRFSRMKGEDLHDMFTRQAEVGDLARRMEKAAEELGWIDTPSGAKFHAHQTYERAMGEYEAREAQRRQAWTPEERRQMAPYQHSQAIPEPRLIDMRLLQTPDEPQALSGLLGRALGPSPEARGTALSLLGIGLLPKDAE